jgi:hypothetical protein
VSPTINNNNNNMSSRLFGHPGPFQRALWREKERKRIMEEEKQAKEREEQEQEEQEKQEQEQEEIKPSSSRGIIFEAKPTLTELMKAMAELKGDDNIDLQHALNLLEEFPVDRISKKRRYCPRLMYRFFGGDECPETDHFDFVILK